MFGKPKINDPYNTMGGQPPRQQKELISGISYNDPRGLKGRVRRAGPGSIDDLWSEFADANPDLSFQDMRTVLVRDMALDGSSADEIARFQRDAPRRVRDR